MHDFIWQLAIVAALFAVIGTVEWWLLERWVKREGVSRGKGHRD